MLFPAFVLVAVDCKHNSLKERVDFGHGDKSAKMGDMTRLGLQEEQKIAVLLSFVVVGKGALLNFGRFIQMASDFFSLYRERLVI